METVFEGWLREKGVILGSDKWDWETPYVPGFTDWFEGRHIRDEAIAQFGFAMITQATVNDLALYSPLLEIGAGTGYWAYELARAGADIIATDPQPYSDVGIKPEKRWGDVLALSANAAIRTYGVGRTLLMCWPGLGLGWPAEALWLYASLNGLRVIYIGEGECGCTGDDEYHRILADQWVLVRVIDIPRWVGIHDRCFVYERSIDR